MIALVALLLLIWSNAAVGFVGSGANAANVMYFALIAVPFVGGAISRFKSDGMSITMVVTAIIQALITGFAFMADLVGEDERVAILGINAFFIMLWIGSALLFKRAAERAPR